MSHASEHRVPKIEIKNQVELTAEQRELLEPLIERDSKAFFEFMQKKITDVTEDLVAAFAEHNTALSPEDVEPLLVAGGVEQHAAHEAAKMIAFTAKHATSPENFQTLLAEQFDPERRLPLTMQHYRENTPGSWYNTPQGEARLHQLLKQLETVN